MAISKNRSSTPALPTGTEAEFYSAQIVQDMHLRIRQLEMLVHAAEAQGFVSDTSTPMDFPDDYFSLTNIQKAIVMATVGTPEQEKLARQFFGQFFGIGCRLLKEGPKQ